MHEPAAWSKHLITQAKLQFAWRLCHGSTGKPIPAWSVLLIAINLLVRRKSKFPFIIPTLCMVGWELCTTHQTLWQENSVQLRDRLSLQWRPSDAADLNALMSGCSSFMPQFSAPKQAKHQSRTEKKQPSTAAQSETKDVWTVLATLLGCKRHVQMTHLPSNKGPKLRPWELRRLQMYLFVWIKKKKNK